MKCKGKGVFLHLLVWSWIIGFTFVWVLPDTVTNLIKPIVVFGFFADVVRKKREIRIDVFGGILILFGGYALLRSVFGTDIQWISVLSFGANVLYTCCICMTRYEKEEYAYLLRMLKVASLVMAVIVLCSNPLPSLPDNNVMKLFSAQVNKNSVPYLIAPGTLICMDQLLSRKKKIEKLVYGIELSVLIYAGVYPMSRGGFLAILLPLVVLLIEWIVFVIKQKEFTKLYVCIVLCNLFAAVGLLLIQGRYREKLLTLGSYTYFSSREVLARAGIEMTEGSELFGKGFGYYQKIMQTDYGSHNCFVDVYVALGIIGVLIFVGIFVYLLLRVRNNLGIAWLGIAFICATVESQMSYQLWIPIAMAYMLCDRSRRSVWKEEQ